MKTVIRTATWQTINGDMKRATYEFDPRKKQFRFRTHGRPISLLYNIADTIGQSTFRWDSSQILNLQS